MAISNDTGSRPALQGVTFRAIVTGLVCTAFLAVATPVSDLLVQGTWIAACHLPIGVIFVFVLLVIGINVPLKKLGISSPNLADAIMMSMWTPEPAIEWGDIDYPNRRVV